MAKKKVAKRKRGPVAELTGAQLQGEYAFVAIGARPSKDYASANFDIGLNLRLLPGEEGADALDRIIDVLLDRFENRAPDVVQKIVAYNERVKRGR